MIKGLELEIVPIRFDMMDTFTGDIGRELANTFSPGNRRLIWRARIAMAKQAGKEEKNKEVIEDGFRKRSKYQHP